MVERKGRKISIVESVAVVPVRAPAAKRTDDAPRAPRASRGDTRERDRAAALRTLRLEAAAIEGVAATIDGPFVEALDLLDSATGRVVVTGMGKSGHIARKIAATLASTGTPAVFVHPAEASHGDLGMIVAGDAVLALSNSGETGELGDVISHAKRRGIPLVAITSRARSALAEAADITLTLPGVPEACPHGLAPTTSTVAMLALGDALAMALLERSEFSTDDYKMLHPGGHLGRRLLRVADIMHQGREMPLTTGETAMSEAILLMTEKRFGSVGVVDGEGRLAGIITDGDLRRHMGPALLAKRVDEVMTAAPQTIRPKALAAEALNLMNTRGIGCLFAVEDGRPVGILNIHDCLRAGVE